MLKMEDDFSIEKLNGDNYHLWQHKVKTLLFKKKLWFVVREEAQQLTPEAQQIWEEKDNAALTLIRLLVEDSQLIHLMEATTAKSAWGILKNCYEKYSLQDEIDLMRSLLHSNLPDGGNMENHLEKFMTTAGKLMSMRMNLNDNILARILLSTIPESYRDVIETFEAQPLENVTFSLVRLKLLNEYRCKKGRNI